VPLPHVLSIPERYDSEPDVTGRGVVVAFVDSAFFAHPDLMRPTRRVRAYVDVTRERPNARDFHTPSVTSWHGTMATCCAAGNGYLSGGRYRGLAPDAEVVLIRAGDESGRILGKNVASAIRAPLRHPELAVRILNVSLGVDADDPDAADVDRAVQEVVAAGICVFAAAGNSPDRAPSPPASSAAAITVGGLDDRNTHDTRDDTPFPSSHAGRKPELLAPAAQLPAPMLPGTLVAREAQPLLQLLSILEDIASDEETAIFMGDRLADVERESVASITRAVEERIAFRKYISPEYQHVDGTSFASPIAASVAAQMLEVAPTLTPRELRQGLIATASPLPDVPRALQGAGVIQPRAAVAWARTHARVKS
jgi:serine protease AprX